MILYTIVYARMGENDLEEVEMEFESFWQAQYCARELTEVGLPFRWKFDFVKAPKQYEFMF